MWSHGQHYSEPLDAFLAQISHITHRALHPFMCLDDPSWVGLRGGCGGCNLLNHTDPCLSVFPTQDLTPRHKRPETRLRLKRVCCREYGILIAFLLDFRIESLSYQLLGPIPRATLWFVLFCYFLLAVFSLNNFTSFILDALYSISEPTKIFVRLWCGSRSSHRKRFMCYSAALMVFWYLINVVEQTATPCNTSQLLLILTMTTILELQIFYKCLPPIKLTLSGQ